MKDPWYKRFPRDWRGDVALRSCSIAARGLWSEMLDLAHDCPERGVLRLGGKALDAGALAVQCAVPFAEANALLAELEKAGVFSRTADGAIFSRRMVRDTRLSNARAEAGKAGAEAFARANGSANGSAKGVSQKSEVRSQKSEGQKPEKRRAPRAVATGPQAEVIQHWIVEWARTRLDAAWKITPRDCAHFSELLKDWDVIEIKQRITRMLDSPDPFYARAASPGVLQANFNQLAVTVHAPKFVSMTDQNLSNLEEARRLIAAGEHRKELPL